MSSYDFRILNSSWVDFLKGIASATLKSFPLPKPEFGTMFQKTVSEPKPNPMPNFIAFQIFCQIWHTNYTLVHTMAFPLNLS